MSKRDQQAADYAHETEQELLDRYRRGIFVAQNYREGEHAGLVMSHMAHSMSIALRELADFGFAPVRPKLSVSWGEGNPIVTLGMKWDRLEKVK